MQPQFEKTDTQMYSDVLDELEADAGVKQTDIGVEVRAGIVTLSGTVESCAERLAAQEAAHRVVGMHDVANDISIRGPELRRLDDSDIAREVRDALRGDLFLAEERIVTTVSDGVVTLEGTVDVWTQFDHAASSVRNLRGVREVRNLLRVEPACSDGGQLCSSHLIEVRDAAGPTR